MKLTKTMFFKRRFFIITLQVSSGKLELRHLIKKYFLEQIFGKKIEKIAESFSKFLD